MEDRQDERWMRLALAEAEQALANGEFPVGCVIVHRDQVVAVGHRINSRERANEMDHAEILALRSLLELEPAPDPAELAVYSTMEPCLMCFSALILNGIRTIIYAYEDIMGGGTNLPLHDLNPLYRSMQVKIVSGILRRESMRLFAGFFERPENRYWSDSLLAEYTLAQSRASDL